MGQPEPIRGNRLEPLVDGAATFRRVADEIAQAQRSLSLLQLLQKPDFVPEPPRGPTLNESLLEAAKRGVIVRILLNSNWLGPDDYAKTRRWFAERAADEDMPVPVRVRKYPLTPGVAHAKLLLVDAQRVVMIDPPFEPRWWDTPAHKLFSRRRGEGLPQHNVSCAIEGPIVEKLHDFYRGLWDARAAASHDGETRMEPSLPLRPRGDLTCSIALTCPTGLFHRDGRREILHAYEDAIARAQRWIYLENQYFTSLPVRRALRAALDANPELEIILLVNEKPDVLTYPRWQDKRLRELGWPDEPRLGVFSLWKTGTARGRIAARPIYIHSKIGIVDDRWGTIGSANLDDVSLDTAREFGFPNQRSIELNLTLLDGVDGAPTTGDVSGMRRRLWGEHLGAPVEELEKEPSDGWLRAWRARAERNLDALAGRGVVAGNVLPYHPDLPRDVRRLDKKASTGEA